MSKAPNKLEWSKRCTRDESEIAEHRTWKSKCGLFRVLETNFKLGRYNDEHGNFLGYPVYYTASRLQGEDDWKYLSEHRRLSAAKKQCDYFARYGCIKPSQTKEAKAIKRGKAKRQARKETDV